MRREVLLSIGLGVLTVCVFGQVRDHDFLTWDDPDYVTRNEHVQAGLTWTSIRVALVTNFMGNWHPLTMLSLMADRQCFGPEPEGFLITNLLLHLASTLLLFVILRRFTGAVWPSALVAALFAIHPMHVEPVAWISSRKDVLSTFFMMLTLLAYGAYVRRPGARRYLLVMVFLAAGLLSKAMLVTLPFALLLVDYWPLGRLQVNQLRDLPRAARPFLIEKLPLMAIALGVAGIAYLTQNRVGAVQDFEAFPLWARLQNVVVAYASYIGKLVLPLGLSPLYPHPGRALPLWKVLAAAIVLCAFTAVAVRTWRSRPCLAVGWFWFLGTLVPVIGLVQIGGHAMADRYSYIPFIGLFVAVAWTLQRLVEARPGARVATSMATSAVVLLFAVLAWQQVGYWRDSITLYERALAVDENNITMRNNLGYFLYLQEEKEKAALEFVAALKTDPNNTRAMVGLGQVLVDQGLLKEAMELFLRCREQNPDEADAYYNMGRIMNLRRDFRAAEFYFRDALRLDWNNPKTHNNLGNSLAQQGKLKQAISHYNESLRIDPRNAIAHINLANACALEQNHTEARRHLNEALRLDPGLEIARELLGSLQSEGARD